jgi:hypothetical protein
LKSNASYPNKLWRKKYLHVKTLTCKSVENRMVCSSKPMALEVLLLHPKSTTLAVVQ